jgi:hypothetical protein
VAARGGTEESFAGCLLGLALGDAVGVASHAHQAASLGELNRALGAERPPPDERLAAPGGGGLLHLQLPGGQFGLPLGCWSDRTAAALETAQSLLAAGRHDPADVLLRLLRLHRTGVGGCRPGACPGLDAPTVDSLEAFERVGAQVAPHTPPPPTPPSSRPPQRGPNRTNNSTARAQGGRRIHARTAPAIDSSAALARVPPLVLRLALHDPAEALAAAAESTRTTHNSTVTVRTQTLPLRSKEISQPLERDEPPFGRVASVGIEAGKAAHRQGGGGGGRRDDRAWRASTVGTWVGAAVGRGGGSPMPPPLPAPPRARARWAQVDASRYLAAVLAGLVRAEGGTPRAALKAAVLAPRFSPAPDVWCAKPLSRDARDVADGAFRCAACPRVLRDAAPAVLTQALWALLAADSFEHGADPRARLRRDGGAIASDAGPARATGLELLLQHRAERAALSVCPARRPARAGGSGAWPNDPNESGRGLGNGSSNGDVAIARRCTAASPARSGACRRSQRRGWRSEPAPRRRWTPLLGAALPQMLRAAAGGAPPSPVPLRLPAPLGS